VTSAGTRAVRGAAWTILTGIASRGLGLVGTVVLTYYLARETIGEVSDASIVVLLANQFSTIGVGQYLIAKPKLGRNVAWHATVFHLVLGVIAIGACVLFQSSLAVWMKAPTLAMYVPGLAVSMLIDRVSFVPERILARDMRFRVIGLSRTAGEITYTALSVSLAMAGFGGMAVVYANIARSALRTVMVLRACGMKDWATPSAFSGKTFRAMMSFGVPFSIGASAGFAARRFDNALVSAFFGTSVVGMYNLAYNVADVPAVQVGEQIGDVLLPSFAHMKHEERKDALVRATGLLGLVVFPLAVGLGAVASTVVRAILKPEWADVGPMLMVLSALSVTRPVGWTISAYLQARDKPRVVMGLEIVKLAAIVASIVAFERLGALWACGGVGVAFAAHALASIWIVYRIDAIPFLKLLGRGMPPLLACVPLIAAVIGARYAMRAIGIESASSQLAIEIIAGALGYLAGAFSIARSTSNDFIALVRAAIRRRAR
jgi:PST family polysaccharide transporter